MLLNKSYRNKYLSLIHNIFYNVSEYSKLNANKLQNLMNGDFGVFMLTLYYYEYINEFTDNNWYSTNLELLENILLSIPLLKEYTFATGVTGVLWGINYLIKNDFIELSSNDSLIKFDELLARKAQINFQYDFLHGALGIVLYFLSENNEKADNYVSDFIDEFEKKSKKNN